MQNSSHKFRESMALIFQKFHIGFTCDIDMHAFRPPEIWRFTLWILTVSKVLMIHHQFLILRKKIHCFITFPMQDQNKKTKVDSLFYDFCKSTWMTHSVKKMFVVCVHCTILSSDEYLNMFIWLHIYMKISDICLFSKIFWTYGWLVDTHSLSSSEFLESSVLLRTHVWFITSFPGHF